MPNNASLNPAKIDRWKLIAGKIKPNLDSMPIFTERHTELEETISEAETLQVRQKELMAELQDLNRRRSELALAGEELRLRLSALLQAEYGFKSKKLIEFGVKPRQRRSSAKKPEVAEIASIAK